METAVLRRGTAPFAAVSVAAEVTSAETHRDALRAALPGDHAGFHGKIASVKDVHCGKVAVDGKVTRQWKQLASQLRGLS